MVQPLATELIHNPKYISYEGWSTVPLDTVRTAIGRFDTTRMASSRGMMAVVRIERVCIEARDLIEHVGKEYRDNGSTSFDTDSAVEDWRDRAIEAARLLDSRNAAQAA